MTLEYPLKAYVFDSYREALFKFGGRLVFKRKGISSRKTTAQEIINWVVRNEK